MNQPHKHAELIKAWADGAPIQYRAVPHHGDWLDAPEHLIWEWHAEYRIKPKPDFSQIMDVYMNKMYQHYPDGFRERRSMIDNFALLGTMNLTFDGTTGQLKSAEIIND